MPGGVDQLAIQVTGSSPPTPATGTTTRPTAGSTATRRTLRKYLMKDQQQTKDR